MNSRECVSERAGERERERPRQRQLSINFPRAAHMAHLSNPAVGLPSATNTRHQRTLTCSASCPPDSVRGVRRCCCCCSSASKMASPAPYCSPPLGPGVLGRSSALTSGSDESPPRRSSLFRILYANPSVLVVCGFGGGSGFSAGSYLSKGREWGKEGATNESPFWSAAWFFLRFADHVVSRKGSERAGAPCVI